MYTSKDWFLYEGNTARNELNKSNKPKTKKLENLIPRKPKRKCPNSQADKNNEIF